jgi:DNA-binding IclR family transcriptional regulator
MTSLTPRSAPLSAEAASVLSALAADADYPGLRLNDLSDVTSLPTGHVGRHLRTLEADRLAAFAGGVWHLTLRGRRIAEDVRLAAVDAALAA